MPVKLGTDIHVLTYMYTRILWIVGKNPKALGQRGSQRKEETFPRPHSDIKLMKTQIFHPPFSLTHSSHIYEILKMKLDGYVFRIHVYRMEITQQWFGDWRSCSASVRFLPWSLAVAVPSPLLIGFVGARKCWAHITVVGNWAVSWLPRASDLFVDGDPWFPVSCIFRKQTGNQMVIVSICVDFCLARRRLALRRVKGPGIGCQACSIPWMRWPQAHIFQ